LGGVGPQERTWGEDKKEKVGGTTTDKRRDGNRKGGLRKQKGKRKKKFEKNVLSAEEFAGL